MNKIFENRKGFSLAELMVVVTILCVLFGVVAINVISYQKKVRQLGYDSNAEILFEAAQNRLTELYAAQGDKIEEVFPDALEVTANGSKNGLSYIAPEETPVSARLLFPAFQAASELTSKNWRVEFDMKTGIVYAAFYSKKMPSDQYADAMRKKDSKGLRADAEVGYCGYGETDESPVLSSYNKMKDYRMQLLIVNKDVLRAEARIKVPDGVAVTPHFVISGKLSHRVESGGDLDGRIMTETDIVEGGTVYTFHLVLDALDLLPDMIPGSDYRFSEICPKLTPGEDIEISVYASFEGTDEEDTAPVTSETGSLFSSYDAGTETAYIRYGRHLQNLSEGVSGVGTAPESEQAKVLVRNVVQEKSINFTDDGEDMWTRLYPESSRQKNGAGLTALESWNNHHAYRAFEPIINGSIQGTFSASTENASGCTITGLFVDTEGNGGVFDTFSGTAVSGISFAGAYVHAARNAGAFAGQINSGAVTLNNCGSYLLYPDYCILIKDALKENVITQKTFQVEALNGDYNMKN